MTMTPKELETHIEDQQKSFKELKSLVEKGIFTSEDKEKLEKINKSLDVAETKNQEMVTNLETAKTRGDEFSSKIKELEKKLYRMPGGAGGVSGTPEAKAFEVFVKRGIGELNSEEKTALIEVQKAYMRTDVLVEGGALNMPPEMSTEIIKNLTEVSPMRTIARVKQGSSKSYKQPVRTSLLSGAGTGEGGSAPETSSKYGEIEIFTKKMMSITVLSTEIIQDSAFNMESEVITDAREDYEQQEGQWYVTGAGPLQAKGFMNNSKIATRNSTVANDITSNSLIFLTGDLKIGYNPVYVFNRQTLARIRTFTNGFGGYQWVPSGSAGLAPGVPSEINGYRYVIMQDMPNIGAGNEPVAYGDFRRSYLIYDRIGIEMIRDAFTLAAEGKVRFVISRRTGGDVIKAEGIKKLKCAEAA
jgi:HK97 family phage major capsid protein